MSTSSPPASPPRPLKVLWLIKGLGPGGAEQLLVNHAAVRTDDAVTYEAAYLVTVKDTHVTSLEALGVPVTHLRGDRQHRPGWLRRLRHLVRDHDIDVIHTHSPSVAAMARLLVRTLPRGTRPGLVYTEHNRWPRHARATRWANMVTFPLDDAQVAVSHDVRSTIPRLLRWPVEVIDHGVDVGTVGLLRDKRADARAELGVSDDEVVVGIVANFRAEKAYDVFLDAVAAAVRSRAERPGTRVRFVSIGQGPLESMMRSRAAGRGLDEHLQFLGYRDDATRLMSAFDIFTLSSRHEGLPVSLMEALALGTPVVATRVGGIPEAVTHDREGVLVPAGDPFALARAWIDLADDPARLERYRAAALATAPRFDIRTAVERLERVYRATARRSRG